MFVAPEILLAPDVAERLLLPAVDVISLFPVVAVTVLPVPPVRAFFAPAVNVLLFAVAVIVLPVAPVIVFVVPAVIVLAAAVEVIVLLPVVAVTTLSPVVAVTVLPVPPVRA